MKIIAGLGNPGKEYEHTRHNMGFDVIDILADRWKVASWKKDMKADIATVIVGGEKVLLVKPLTYMNLSGEAVGAIAKYYKVDLDDIFIICDDLDLPPGKTRIRKKGSAGGHNGIKSLIACLGSEAFNRQRMGTPSSSMSCSALTGKISSLSRRRRFILLTPSRTHWLMASIMP